MTSKMAGTHSGLVGVTTPMETGSNHLTARHRIRRHARRRGGGASGQVVAAVVMIGLAAAACGRVGAGSGGSGSPSFTPSTPAGRPTGARDLLVRIETRGGFIAPQALLLRYPTFSLYGDGTVITQGAQPAIYPGPAMPSLIATKLTAAGVDAVLGAARQAGLYGPNEDYHGVLAPDAGVTIITLNDGRTVHTISVTAFGAAPQQGVSKTEAGARAALQTLSNRLADLRSWLPKGSVGPDRPYQPTAVRVFVAPGAPQGNGVTEPSIAWPLAAPLSSFGAPVPTPLGGGPTSCGVVQGEDLAKLLPDLRRATQISPWTSDGSAYTLSLRPLLPDESGC